MRMYRVDRSWTKYWEFCVGVVADVVVVVVGMVVPAGISGGAEILLLLVGRV